MSDDARVTITRGGREEGFALRPGDVVRVRMLADGTVQTAREVTDPERRRALEEHLSREWHHRGP